MDISQITAHSQQAITLGQQVTDSHSDWWAGAAGAIVGAIVGGLIGMFASALQDWVRALFFSPKFEVSTENAPPCSVMIPVTNPSDGSFLWLSLYLRIFIKNIGSAVARNVEVYAQSLYRLDENGSRELVRPFPPMNLGWANTRTNTSESMYFPNISPGMGRYCDVCYVSDPSRLAEFDKARHAQPNTGILSSSSSWAVMFPPSVPEPHQGHDAQPSAETFMGFMVQFPPNNWGNVVRAGTYLLEVLVAAENCRPILCTIKIFHAGKWSADETAMLSNLAHMEVFKTSKVRKR